MFIYCNGMHIDFSVVFSVLLLLRARPTLSVPQFQHLQNEGL